MSKKDNTDNKENNKSDVSNKKKSASGEKINIHEEYLQIYEKHVNKYGPKTILLMQVGSFHECYATETRGPNLFAISDILNIVCTRKDKSITKIDEKNPFMLGFTSVALQKYLKILIDNQYTVVVIDQVTPAPNPQRAVTGIYSPSTYIDNVSVENKYLMTLYFETNSALKSSKSNISVGMCAIDSSTGQVYWYESHGSGVLNENESWEEAQRFYHFFRPVELIVYQIDNTMQNSLNQNSLNQAHAKPINLSERIDLLPNQVLLSYTKINPEFGKINYQNKILKKVYPGCGMESPISVFNLEKHPFATIALTNSFEYIHQHNENLIKELGEPKYFNEHKYMVLGNNAQYQLNVIDYYNWDKIDSKFHSLNAVVNNCCTPMGKRMLKQRLCAPFTDPVTINKYYELTELVLGFNLWENIRGYLKEISDLDKLFRKLSVKFIQPYELYSIYKSLQNVGRIVEILLKSEFKKNLLEMFNKNQIKQLEKSMNQIEEKFEIEVLRVSNLVEIKNSFYQHGIYNDIDELVDQIDNGIGIVEKLSKLLEDVIPDISLKISHNSNDGYYLTTSKIRGEKLQSELKKQKITFKLGTNEIKLNELDFKYLKNTTKISYPGLSTHSDEIDELYGQLDSKIKEYFYTDCTEWYKSNIQVLGNLINMVVQLDLITNNAFTSVKYHYTKPILQTPSVSSKSVSSKTETKTELESEESEKTEKTSIGESFIYAKNLRHPIIERIIDYEYVPHDVKLDSETRGNMIYGYNGVGKSSIMKAIGTSLIMAQCGMYVPADSFEYGIFDSLYTRISGNDNLFKGHSSFIIEMNELRTILKKANSKSLVIGDEICRGTEYLSANAIVATSILKLIDLRAKFLFATHLHELADIEQIKSLDMIKFYHLSVEKQGDELVFNRKLTEGTGEQIYGITVAQYILDDPLFISKAIELKNGLLEKSGTNTKLVSDKKSLYNKEIYMDNCTICGSEKKLEAHHINWQKDFTLGSNGLINNKKKHILKDSKANLIVLCSDCHDNLHSKNFTIEGLVKTSNGIKAI
jgi:DNA mismatch repair protein MutS